MHQKPAQVVLADPPTPFRDVDLFNPAIDRTPVDLDAESVPAVRRPPAVGWGHRVRANRAGVAVALLAALSFTVSLLLQATLYRHGSGDADEAAYVLQARMLLDGQLTLDQDLVEPFFRPWLTGVHDGRVFTKYLPGWPAMLAAS